MQIDKRYQKRRRATKAMEQLAGLREEIKGREVLRGILEIAAYLCVSMGTANDYIKVYGMPAMRIGGHKSANPKRGGPGEQGEWMTTKGLINQWIAVEHFKYLDRNGYIADDQANEERDQEGQTSASRAAGKSRDIWARALSD